MFYIFYILFAIVSNRVELPDSLNLSGNANIRFSIDFEKSLIYPSVLPIKALSIFRNISDKEHPNYLKRNYYKRYLTICSSACYQSIPHFIWVVNYSKSYSYLLTPNIHPNSLRAPPTVYYI